MAAPLLPVPKGGWFMARPAAAEHCFFMASAAGAGVALGVGGQAIVLNDEKGAVLRLVGQQIGLQVNLDLSGLAISM